MRVALRVHQHQPRRPMVFSARAAEPMLPGCWVPTSTMRMRASRGRFGCAEGSFMGAMLNCAPPVYRAGPLFTPVRPPVPCPGGPSAPCKNPPSPSWSRPLARAATCCCGIMNKLDALNVVEKDRMDYASEVDSQAEQAIIKELKRAYPEYGILGEEGGAQKPARGRRQVHLGDRSARRHQQLPARLSALLRVDRARRKRRTHPRRDLRSDAQRAVHRQPRQRRRAQRTPDPRHRTQGPVRRDASSPASRRASARAPARSWNACANCCAMPRTCAAPVRRRWTWPMWPAAASMPISSRGEALGYRRRLADGARGWRPDLRLPRRQPGPHGFGQRRRARQIVAGNVKICRSVAEDHRVFGLRRKLQLTASSVFVGAALAASSSSISMR